MAQRPPALPSLGAILAWRADHEPDAIAYKFLRSDRTAASVSWRGVHARAAVLARELPAGRPVLLVHRAGLEFPVAFFACLYAGAIPVAVHPPHRGLSRRYLDSFAAIAEDVRPAAVVGTARTLDQLPPEARALPVLRGASWVAQLEGQDAETAAAADIEPRPTTAGPDDLAYLQYTSGSTARPRGVMINHGPLMEQLEYYRLRGGPSWHQAVLVGWLPHQHDYGLVGFVLSALYMGISYIFFSPSTFLRDPARWLAAISGEGGTYSGAPAFAYDLCARTVEPAAISGLDLSAWTIASTGGEPISASTLERFAARLAPYGFDRAAFLPSYGLAEAVLCVSARQGVKTCRGRVSVGSTLAGQRAIVVDPGTRQLCAEGELGEVWVAGRSLAAGYWRRPQETAEVFGALPADADGGPYLRTGDLGFIDGGELYVADRLKDAIVVRGVNYHPADLERTVQTLDPALIPGGGAAFQVEQDGEERLVVVQEALDAPGSDRLALLTRIRSAVAEDQGVQVHAVALIAAGSIARTPSGKVRRHEVRDAWLAGSLTTTAERKFGAPDSVQRELARLWSQALDRPHVGVHDDFFALGGDSLAAARIMAGIAEAYGVQLPVRVLFEQRTVAELAAEVKRLPHAHGTPTAGSMASAPIAALPLSAPALSAPALSAPVEALLREILKRLDQIEARLPELPAGAAAAEASALLSDGQREVLQLAALAPGASAAFHLTAVLELTRQPEEPSLRRALQVLTDRHESLRTELDRDGAGARIRPAVEVELGSVADPGDLAAWLGSERMRPFDLHRAPLWRATLLLTEPPRLVVVAHHLIADGASMQILAAELAGALAGAELPADPLSYTAYRRARTERATPAAMAAHERYWLAEVGADLPVLELPSDRPRPERLSVDAATHTATIGPEFRRALVRLGHENGATLFMALLAGYTALLHRLSGQDEFVLGFTAAGRELPGASTVVGECSSVLPLLSRADDDPTVPGHLARTRDRVLGALEHQDFTLSMLLELRRAPVDPSRPLRVATFFSFQPQPAPSDLFRVAPDLQAQAVRHCVGDLELSVWDTGSELRLDFVYSTVLFGEPTVRRYAESFLRLLEGMSTDPARSLGTVPILAEQERRLLTEWGTGAAAEPVGEAFPELFARQAERTPAATAVLDGEVLLTYRELRRRAGAVAAYLRAAGVRPGAVVALLAERGAGYLTALLGILDAGAVALPLGPALPERRHREMLLRSGAGHLLVGPGLERAAEATRGLAIDPATLAAALAHVGPLGAPFAPGPSAPAYAIYTSGSTGAPKAALIAHGGMINHLYAKLEALGLSAADVVAQTAPQTFDISIWQQLAPLLVGGAVRILRDEVTNDPVRLLSEVHSRGVTVLELVPSVLGALLDEGVQRAAGRPSLPALRWAILTGEALPPELCRRWMRFYPRVPLLNAYGPTECSDDVTHHVLNWPPSAAATRVPIGRPIRGARLYVLDRHHQLVPQGTPGELYVGGTCVGLGYLGDPAQTAAAFVPDPFLGGETLYRTGDLVRHRGDGALEFIGRIDDQQKLRGIRVEPEEVEAVLAQHPAVGDCAVTVTEATDGTRVLAGYVTPSNGALPPSAELRRHLRARLPPHLVPSTITVVSAVPRNRSGKVDRRSLPTPVLDRNAYAGPRVAPRTRAERAVAAIVTSILDHQVGMFDDFFELGGRSLEAARLSAQVRTTLGVELPLFEIYRDPTIAEIARFVASSAGWPDGA